MTQLEEISYTEAWIAQLERRRADREAMADGLVLGEPQCAEGCGRCTLACCMTTIVLDQARGILRDLISPSGAVH